MFTKEGISHLFDRICSEEEAQEVPTSNIEKFVVLDNGRLVPIEPGGMVELALNELGAKVVEAEIPSGEKIAQEK